VRSQNGAASAIDLGSGTLRVQVERAEAVLPEQALAAAGTRARPPQINAIIVTRPADAVLAARITWATITEARCADPLFGALIATGNVASEQVDALFRQVARL
jgi:hypothetical protein